MKLQTRSVNRTDVLNAWDAADRERELGEPCKPFVSHSESSWASRACPPGGDRGCDTCKQALPPSHAEGDHHPYSAVVTFVSTPSADRKRQRMYIHDHDCVNFQVP